MTFRTCQYKCIMLPQVLLEGSIIPLSLRTKLLGIHINEMLKWNDHCDLLKSKQNTGHYMIYRLKKITNLQVCRTVYFASFNAHLRYGITIWGNDPQSKKIYILQKKVVTLMCNINQRSTCREIFRLLGILLLPCIYIYEMIAGSSIIRAN